MGDTKTLFSFDSAMCNIHHVEFILQCRRQVKVKFSVQLLLFLCVANCFVWFLSESIKDLFSPSQLVF